MLQDRRGSDTASLHCWDTRSAEVVYPGIYFVIYLSRMSLVSIMHLPYNGTFAWYVRMRISLSVVIVAIITIGDRNGVICDICLGSVVLVFYEVNIFHTVWMDLK